MQPTFSYSWRRRNLLAIALSLGIVVVLDFSTPVEYVIGYLYLCPLLFSTGRLPRKFILGLTLLMVLLTLLNLELPNHQLVTLPALVNRILASISLTVTAILCDRNTIYAQAIASQKAEIQSRNQLEGLREDFAGTLTHDLKTPVLGGISTLHAFLQGEFGEITNSQKQVLMTMERSHQTSLKLLDTLLDVYRNDTKGLELNLEPIDLTQLVEESANQVAILAHHRQIQIIVRHGNSEFRRSLWVKADAFQLQRVLMNLLVNAINHSRRGDRVEVVLESNGFQQVVKVLDQGAGLNPDELSQLFQRFYQGKSDRQAQGSGLGLYLARQIITAHQGTICAENRSPKGAIFAIQLPIHSP